MTHERMREYKEESTPLHLDRGSLRRAEERDFASSELMNSLGQEFRDLELRYQSAANDLLQYEATLTEGGKHAMQGSPKLREIALKLDTEIRQKRDARREERDGIQKALDDVRQQIIEAGGNPSDYTLQ